MEDQIMEDQQLGRWFVVQTMSGKEFKVKTTMEKMIPLEGVEDLVYEVVVPTERVTEVCRGKKTTTDRKFFPGYILVRAKIFEDDGEILGRSWYFIRNTQGVIGFLGGDKPVPLQNYEVDEILNQAKGEEDVIKPKVLFEVGETVIIKDGSFANFEGCIESVDPGRGRLTLSVSIFGRSTPVELEYWQVERNI